MNQESFANDRSNEIIHGMLMKQELTKLHRIQSQELRTIYQGKRPSVKGMYEKAKQDYLTIRTVSHLLPITYVEPGKLNIQMKQWEILDALIPLYANCPQTVPKVIKTSIYKGSMM